MMPLTLAQTYLQDMKTIWEWLNRKVKLFGQALCYLNAECGFDPPNST